MLRSDCHKKVPLFPNLCAKNFPSTRTVGGTQIGILYRFLFAHDNECPYTQDTEENFKINLNFQPYINTLISL